jgi:hypothetical protein
MLLALSIAIRERRWSCANRTNGVAKSRHCCTRSWRPPEETVYVAWDKATTHADDEVEAVVRSAVGRLVLLYLPTYSP